MQKINKFDKKAAVDVQDHMMQVLKAEAENLGLVVERKTGKYNDSTFRFEIVFTAGGEEGKEQKQKEDFAEVAILYGLSDKDYGSILIIKNKKYKLVRINTRRNCRYPFECESVGEGNGARLPHEYKHMIIAARQ